MNQVTRPRTPTRIFPAVLPHANPVPQICLTLPSEDARIAAYLFGRLRDVEDRHECALARIANDGADGETLAAALFLEGVRRDLNAKFIARAAEALGL